MWHKVWIWERRTNKGGKCYYVRWYDDSGRLRAEAVGPDRKLAERLRAEREVELNSGAYRSVPEVSYEEFIANEMTAMKSRMAHASLADLKFTLRDFREATGVRKLSDITPGVIDGYFSQRLGSVAVATANKGLRTLKASLQRAVERGLLQVNPAARIKQVREPEREVRVLTREEVGKLLDAAPSARWRALIGLAVTSGMRLGEMLALRWKDVELENGLVHARNTPDHRTKSGRNRTLPLSPESGELLSRLRRRGELVFHTADGGPWTNNIQSGFRRIVKKAGIARCSMHDLRRTFVSHLAMAGVNAAVVKELAGHADISTTQKYYTRILPESLRAAQAQLPFGAVLRGQRIITKSSHGPEEEEKKTRPRS